MPKIKIEQKEVPHERSYCYLSIIDLLSKMTKEDDKVKRILIYGMIMKEIKHLI